METEAVNMHDETGELTKDFELEAGNYFIFLFIFNWVNFLINSSCVRDENWGWLLFKKNDSVHVPDEQAFIFDGLLIGWEEDIFVDVGNCCVLMYCTISRYKSDRPTWLIK